MRSSPDNADKYRAKQNRPRKRRIVQIVQSDYRHLQT